MSSFEQGGEEGQAPKEPAQQPVSAVVQLDINRISAWTVVKVLVAALAVLVVAWLLYSTLNLLLLLFLSLMIATAIEPMVRYLKRGPFGRSSGVLIVYVGLFAIIMLIGWLTLPVIFEQAGEVGTSVEKSVGELRDSTDGISNPFIKQQVITFADAVDGLARSIQRPAPPSADPANSDETVQAVTKTTITVAEILFAVITVFVVAFYWFNERVLIQRWAMSWFSPFGANRLHRIWDSVEETVGGWVRGQLTLMIIVGVISAVGYFVMGIEYWPVLALFIGIAEAIPLVGPFIGTAPAVLVALIQPDGGLGKALMVVVFAIVLQTVEGNVLVPRVMRHSIGISPLLVIISILFGAAIAGLAGALVAVPLVATVQVIIQEIKEEREGEQRVQEALADAMEVDEANTRQEEVTVARPVGSGTEVVVRETTT